MKKIILSLLLAVMSSVTVLGGASPAVAGDPGPGVERGRYVVRISGCNDCHTPGYIDTAGDVPESEWLTGSSLGWQGPWGTTYPINLRLYFANISEDEWVGRVPELRTRPPMPWFALRAMSDNDLRSIWRFINSLGPAGTAAPAYVPPGTDAPPPLFRLVLPKG